LPGPNVIKNYSRNKAGVFIPGKHIQHSLTFRVLHFRFGLPTKAGNVCQGQTL
jgi:hypothetical protein